MSHVSLFAAVGLVLVLEGLLPLLVPRRWQTMLTAMSQLPANQLRRLGGALVTAGAVIMWLATHQ